MLIRIIISNLKMRNNNLGTEGNELEGNIKLGGGDNEGAFDQPMIR